MIRLLFKVLIAFMLFLPVVSASREEIIFQGAPELIEPAEASTPRDFIDDRMIYTSRGRRHLFPDTYKVLFAGDVMFVWGVEDAIQRYGIQIPFEDWEPLFSSVHLRVINLESSIPLPQRLPAADKAFVFASSSENAITVLKKLQIDIVSLGNNHAMDYQVDGLRDTISILRANGISIVGAGENSDESYAPARRVMKENRIAIFGASDVTEYNYPFSDKKKPGVAFLSESVLKQIVKKEARDTNAILMAHWGLEYSSVPMVSQRRLAKSLLDNGYAAILGHHSHIPQGIEIYKGKPIIYSMGNFIFGSMNSYLNHNILVILHFKNNKIMVIEIIPAFGKFQSFDHIFFPLAPAEAEEFLNEYAILCKKLGTDLVVQGGRGYVFLDKTILNKE